MQLLLVAFLAACALAQTPGTTYPSMMLSYDDPYTGHAAIRLTTDGAEHSIKNCLGDQSHESSSWSPDATKICYGKKRESGCTSPKPEGVYMLDIATGVETFLAPADIGDHDGWVFSRDGAEVYYYFDVNDSTVEVRAVNITTFAVRTLNTLSPTTGGHKITVNCDGSYIAVHQWAPDSLPENRRTAILNTATGQFHPNWPWNSGLPAQDGTVWSPVDPKRVFAQRGALRIYNIDDLSTTASQGSEIAHSIWHPNGIWYLSGSATPNCRLIDISKSSSTNIIAEPSRGRELRAAHPFAHPLDSSRGMQARLVLDCGYFAPRSSALYILTLDQMVNEDWRANRDRVWVSHFSTMVRNDAHPHPQFSPDGTHILWQSDSNRDDLGAVPGTRGGDRKVDLYISPLGSTDAEKRSMLDGHSFRSRAMSEATLGLNGRVMGEGDCRGAVTAGSQARLQRAGDPRTPVRGLY